MHTPPPFPTPPAPDQNDDSLLNELVSLTGLFTPEVIWHEEEQLDDMEEQERAADEQRGRPAEHPGSH